MAKNKTESETSKQASTDDRVMIAQLKGTIAFRDWLIEVAQTERLSVVQFLERSAVEAAERLNYPIPAPRRTSR
jgi:hypothetical protein